MANRSRVILKNNEGTHTSRLIKSFQSIENLEPYEIKPNGVWGSTATININYTLGNVNYDITYKSDDMDFEFNTPFDDNLEANEGEILIYNLKNSSLSKLRQAIAERGNKLKKEKLTITAGYEGDTGVVFQGYITKISTKQENADKVTTIKIINDIECKETLEMTESGSASTILTKLIDMLVRKTNLVKAKIKIARDYTYTDSVSIDKPLESAVKDFSEVCGVSTIINKGNIYCCKLNEIDDVGIFDVSEETGMIGSPQPFTEEVKSGDNTYVVNGFEIDMLFQHKMSVGAAINLKSADYKGTYYVQSGKHTFNQSEAITHIRAIEVV